MPDHPCPTCGSTLGYYDGPNGRPRCLNCFADTEAPKAVEAPKPEPNASGTTVAIASAEAAEEPQDKPAAKPVEEDEQRTKQIDQAQAMATSTKRVEEPSAGKGKARESTPGPSSKRR